MAEVVYDPDIDFVKLHLQWIQENQSFKPKGGLYSIINGKPHYETYYDQMSAMYRELTYPNKYAFVCLQDDVKWKNRDSTEITRHVNEYFGITKKVEYPAFFVTFNFDEKKFVASKVLKDLGVFLQLSWIETCQGMFEYYTEKGCHPHLHMVITVNKYSNKVKDKMFESRLAKYCAATNFIDVKRSKDYHNDYVLLSKASSKQEFMEKDEMWRIENNLPHEIKK